MKKVTRADVAREAGVSETIVSYVMNNNRYVDSEKRKKVLEAVERLHYVPSPTARALAGKGTGNILLLASHIASPHFSELLVSCEKHFSQKGFNVVLSRYRHDDETFIERLIHQNYDGIVIGSTVIGTEAINRLLDAGIPTIVLEMKEFKGIKGDYGVINTGLSQGTEEAMHLFREKGRRRIAFAASVIPALDSSDARYLGYLKAIDHEPIVIKDVSCDLEMAHRIGECWKETKFDGLLCRSDVTAALALKGLSGVGAKVPEDVSIIGFDDTLISSLATPGLTSVRIKRDEIAEHALSLIKALRNGEVKGRAKVQLSTELVLRESH